jgi:hypothetical protein
MELHEALTEIASIRRQIAGAEKFYGYRAIPVAVGGLVAFVAAGVQPSLMVEPSRDLQAYLTLWIAVAVVAGIVPAVDVWRRHSDRWSLGGTLARLAFEQFAPCIFVGGLVTAVIACSAPQLDWTLPSLWGVIFSLGLFASFRLLPTAIVIVATWYLVSGCLCLALGPDRARLAPWTMALIFGIGQWATALVLLFQQHETDDGE